MFEAIFFDMDGLFLDSEPLWHLCQKELMNRLGYDWSDSDQFQCLGGPLTRVTQYMSERLNHSHSPQTLLEEIVDDMKFRLSQQPPFMPGALELSVLLKRSGILHALVSASPRVLVDAVLDGFPDHNFEFSIAAGDIERTKPHPDPYLHAAKLADVDIENCLVFEDSLTGISAARESGAFVVAVPHLIEVTPEPRLEVVPSLSNIDLAMIEKFYQQNVGSLLAR